MKPEGALELDSCKSRGLWRDKVLIGQVHIDAPPS